ncbi:MAG: enoyl-CoA hydratase/isomerase family protein [Planctomycetota bacterium]
MADLASLTFDGPVATLTLRRPEARNALSLELLGSVHERLDELDAMQSGPTVLVFTGEGKSFCAGMDLKQVIIDGPESAGTPRQLLESLARACQRLRLLPSVTVASVSGAAIGGGCGLATVCDLAVTHAEAKLGFPEVDLGLCPAVVAPWVARRIGHGRARTVLLAGGLMSGRDAYELGLVSHVVDSADRLDEETRSVVSSLTAGGPRALRATKELLNTIDGSLAGDLLERGAALSADVLSTDEAQARLRSRLSDQN